MRHGQSEGNTQRIVSAVATKLTDLGVEQAKRTGNELKELGVTVVACSAYVRAQQTAEIIAGELGIDLAHIQVIEELGERTWGEAEGKPNIWDAEWFFTADDDELGIEPRQALLDRMVVALEKMKVIAPANGMMTVVGHGVSGFYLRQAAAGKRNIADFDPHQQMDNAGYIIVDVKEAGNG